MTGAAAHFLFLVSLILQSVPLTPLDTVKHWVAVLTWPAIFLFVVPTTWWLRGYLISVKAVFVTSIHRLEETHTLALNTRSTLTTIKDNHLAHIEAAILGQKEFQKQSLQTLQEISRGIGVLVDRGLRTD